jgi:putative glycosyltransferase (TIGR04348 family)
MRILLATPAPPGSRKGNRVTAVRWAHLLRALGHRVGVAQAYSGQRCDLLIALHARRSAPSVVRFHDMNPGRPLIVALTGTDLYGDIHTSADAKRSLELATRLVLLQPEGVRELPEAVRDRARVIFQSVRPPRRRRRPHADVFEVCVLGHLRPVKDPFRTAQAARLLPATSRVRILHLGAALSEDMAEQARAEEAVNPRYRWLGERPRGRALYILSGCRLLALTSQLEGGANAVSEAVAVGVPVVSSRIAGSVGLLGADYPGYFPYGATRALADLLQHVETDTAFYSDLRARCERLRGLIDPNRERESWEKLLGELEGAARGEPGA